MSAAPIEQAAEMAPETTDTAPQRSTEPPPGALTWSTPKERQEALHAWRVAIIKNWDRDARPVRLAWLLEWLFGKQGFAYASNTYLASQTDIPDNKIRAALLTLEKAGAIVRTNAPEGRRIYPGCGILPRPVTGLRGEPRDPRPVTGLQNLEYKRGRARGVVSTEMQRARAAAEIRERRQAARLSSPSSKDDLPSSAEQALPGPEATGRAAGEPLPRAKP